MYHGVVVVDNAFVVYVFPLFPFSRFHVCSVFLFSRCSRSSPGFPVVLMFPLSRLLGVYVFPLFPLFPCFPVLPVLPIAVPMVPPWLPLALVEADFVT
jgi:hypothetical protein